MIPLPSETSIQSATAIVQRAFDAVQAMRWQEIPGLLHPDALTRFREHQLDLARTREHPPRDSRRSGSELPPAVAEWFDEQRQRQEAVHGGWVSNEFAGVNTLEDLASLGAEEMLSRWLEARDPRTSLRKQLQEKGELLPEVLGPESLPFERREIVGAVQEDAATVQVLYRTRIEHAPDSRLAIATVLRMEDGTWRLWTTWHDPHLFDSFQMSVGIESESERVARLDALKEIPFRWPDDERPVVSAMISGYDGRGMRPDALVLVWSANAESQRIEVPFASVAPLMEFVEPWAYLPELERIEGGDAG